MTKPLRDVIRAAMPGDKFSATKWLECAYRAKCLIFGRTIEFSRKSSFHN